MKLVLIDCYGFFYKAHYAFQNHPLMNSKGEDTSVIFSFYNFLHRIITERHPTRLICTLDAKGPTHRHEQYAEYKAHRPPMPDSLREQIEIIKTTLPQLGLDPFLFSGYEADDIIAHYAFEGMKQNPEMEIEIFSADKDLLQLVSEQVKVVSTDQKNKDYVDYNIARVREKFEVKPENITDYLALVGDSSDNVPGVAGVGKVTAVKLINEFGSVEDIYQKIDEIPEKTKKKLVEGKDNAFLSKELVTLIYPLEGLAEKLPDLKEIDWKAVHPDQLKETFERYECFSLIKKFNLNPSPENASATLIDLLQASSQTVVHEKKDWLAVFERKTIGPENWDEVIDKIKQAKKFVFDLETTSLDTFAAQIVSLVIVPVDNLDEGEKIDSYFNSYYLPVIYKNPQNESGAVIDHEKTFLEKFKPLFEDPKIEKIGHNLKYEYKILKNKGIQLTHLAHDTMAYEYALDPDRNQFKLENLIDTYFGVVKATYKELSKGEPILEIDPAELEKYTYEDGEYTTLIYQAQVKKKPLSKAAADLFQNLEMPLITVLAEIELAGVWLDVPFLKELKKQAVATLKQNQQEIYQLSGEEFNINSTKQLQVILFEKLKIKPIKKTKTGFSTDNYVLQKLEKDHLIAKSLLSYRKYSKLLNTYIQTLPELLNPKTGRIHTHYNQTVAATGRLSSTDPNLQNIPIGEESMGIRKAFIAPPDYVMVSIDYSQVELRILAYLCKDEKLLSAYQNNQDIHALTAHLIFNKPIEEITSDERSIAKTINFSVIYGISSFSLGEDLNISRGEAQFFIDSYFSSYPRVMEYQKEVLDEARKNEFVETYFGRKRWVRDVNSKNFSNKSRAERIAFNSVIQGTASDIIKMAMVNIQNKIIVDEIKAKMVMTVHDELVFYIEKKRTEEVIPLIEKELVAIKPFDEILQVNSSVSQCWDK